MCVCVCVKEGYNVCRNPPCMHTHWTQAFSYRFIPMVAKLVQTALSLGPNQKDASFVGAYSMNGCAQAVRNCPTIATRNPDLEKTLEHTIG